MPEGNVDENVSCLDQGYGYKDGDIVKYQSCILMCRLKHFNVCVSPQKIIKGGQIKMQIWK